MILLALANLSLAAWVYLFLGRGFFWHTGQRLTVAPSLCGDSGSLPSVAVLVLARNEAGLLAQTLPQLLLQDYSGRFHVWLVDDSSTDGTAEVARRVARDLGPEERLSVVMADPLTPGWTGKLWALQQGVQAASTAQPEYLLFVDADIALAPGVLQALVKKAVGDGLHLVSVMALLKLLTGWERMLVPAFVYFFMLLYPAGNAAGVLVVPGRGCRRLVPVGLRGRCRSRSVAAGRGAAGLALMNTSYLSTLRWYRASPALALLLPVIAGVYTLMTIHSAWQFWRGRGGGWKGRTLPPST